MSNPYFSLTDSLGTMKKFRSILVGHEPLTEKVQNIQTTLNGGLDASFGGIYVIHTYSVKVRATETEDDFGSADDLEAFYRLNNPHGTPSNILVLTDHKGVDHNIYMVGQHLPLPTGVMIEGPHAWFIVKCTFRFIPELA